MPYIYILLSASEKFVKTLFGDSKVEDVLRKLDRLTRDEARMIGAQTFGMVRGLENNMEVVMQGA